MRCDAGASIINIGNSIFTMENSDSGGSETLETPNIFLFPSILSLVTILIWSCILERFVLQVCRKKPREIWRKEFLVCFFH